MGDHAKDFQMCSHRTAERVCVHASDISALDEHVADVVKKYSYLLAGPCATAMAELQCRLVFPKIANGTIVPVSYESCTTTISNCVGQAQADRICQAAGPAINGPLAGVSAP